MKRPLFIAVIGYVLGIIVGLYFKKSVVPFCISIIAIYLIIKYVKKYVRRKSKFKLLSFKRYLRYVKIYINFKVIILIIISSIVSNTVILFQEKKYEKIYFDLENQSNLKYTGIIVSDKEEKDFYNKYIVKIEKQKIKLIITVKKNIELEYGDKIEFSGTYVRPEIQRNYKGFDYSKYLKQLKIYGTIKNASINVKEKKQLNFLYQISNNIKTKIVENTNKIFDKETSAILLGLILGDKESLTNETQENFKKAGISHVLAISGMHVAYVILGIDLIFRRLIGKRKNYYLIIFVLIFYMFLTNFSSSITRAGIMGIIMILSKLIYRKNDICISMSASLLVLLIQNPYLIQNLGVLFSYGGVIGIILFNDTVLMFLKNIKIENKKYKYFIRPKIQNYLDKLKEIISVSISVQMVIFPIMIYNLNSINLYFLISSLCISIVIGPIVIIGFLFVILTLINFNISKIFSIFVNISIQILNLVSKIGTWKYAKIYIPTPNIFIIAIFYVIIFLMIFCYKIYSNKRPNATQIRIKNLIALGKFKLRGVGKKQYYTIIVLIFVAFIVPNIMSNEMKIHSVDVGQGDCTFIVTPHNKTILIDGGGSENGSFDVGKSTLLPYILNRGFNSIDTIVISHFDSDHVGGILYVMQEVNVKNVVIGKQFKDCENYEEFKKIVNEKKINVIIANIGQKIKIEKNIYFDVLWPLR